MLYNIYIFILYIYIYICIYLYTYVYVYICVGNKFVNEHIKEFKIHSKKIKESNNPGQRLVLCDYNF